MNQNQFAESIKISMNDNRFILENEKIRRTFLWNNGNLISHAIKDKTNDVTWKFAATKPDFSLPGLTQTTTDGDWYLETIPETPIAPAHQQVIVLTHFQGVSVKRLFRIYQNCPAIACDIFLKGQTSESWESVAIQAGDLRNIENQQAQNMQ